MSARCTRAQHRHVAVVRIQRMLTALLGVFLTACGAVSTGQSTPSSPRGTAAVTGPLSVFAAASLTESFNDAKARVHQAHPGLGITYNFAGSQTLAQQISAGAPADVFAAADTRTMQTLVDAGLVETPVTFVRNRLEIVVATGNPKHISGLADLRRGGLTVVLCDQSVPCGLYGDQALQKAHVTVQPKSLALDVKSVIENVATGNADAGIVYVTDVKAAGTSVTGITIPASQNVIATYPIAVVKATKHRQAAQFFVNSAVDGAVQDALEGRGFLAP